MSARAPAVVTGCAPATFEQFGSSEIGTPARLHDLAPSSAENLVARRSCGGDLGALLGLLEEVWVGQPQWGSSKAPQPQRTRSASRGVGGQAQLKLKRVAERAVAEREGVVDGQGGEQDGGRFGGAAQQTGFVLLCTLQRATVLNGERYNTAGGRRRWRVTCLSGLVAARGEDTHDRPTGILETHMVA